MKFVNMGTYQLQTGICRHMMCMHRVTAGHLVYSPF